MEDLQNYKGSQMHVTFNVKPKEEKAFYASQKCKMYTSLKIFLKVHITSKLLL